MTTLTQKLDQLPSVRMGLRVPDCWFRPIADALAPGTPSVRNAVVRIEYLGQSMEFCAVSAAPGQELYWERRR